MIILIDMNLPPAWVAFFRRHGIEAVHWSEIGDPRAADEVLMGYARVHGQVVFTHDLDFGAILAATHGTAPSVIQVRSQETLPDAMGPMVLAAVHQFEALLQAGALIVVDQSRARARVLPLTGRS